MLMINSDYRMAEYFTKLVKTSLDANQSVDDNTLTNLIYSLESLRINKITPGPNTLDLLDYINAKYSYDDISDKSGFDLGAVFGCMKYLEVAKEIKNESLL